MRSSNSATSVDFCFTMVRVLELLRFFFLRLSDVTHSSASNVSRIFTGRLSYTRTAQCINYFFYKNIVFTLPQFIYGAISAYSGQVWDALLS